MLKFQAWPDEKPAFLGCFSKPRSTHILVVTCLRLQFRQVRSGWQRISGRPKLCEISVQICNLKNWTLTHLNDIFSVLFLLCFRARLYIDALWSPAWKGLTSWLSFVMSNCEGATFQLVSWVSCGLCLYRFLIFALFLIFMCFRWTTSVNLLLYA